MAMFYKQNAFVALLSLACLAALGTAPAAAERTVSRSISVAELGFAEGARIGAAGGSHDFYFPAPRSLTLQKAVLSLAYEAGAAYEGARNVEVLVNGRSVLLKRLQAVNERQTLEAEIGDVAREDDFLRVSVRYSGVITTERCVDLKLSGDHFTVTPQTALRLDIAGNSLTSAAAVLRLMPVKTVIKVPEGKLGEDAVAAALEAARFLRQSGREVRFETYDGSLPKVAAGDTPAAWRTGVLFIQPSEEVPLPAGPADGASRVDLSHFRGVLNIVSLADGPALVATGTAPRLAASFLGTPWRDAVPGNVTIGAAAREDALSDHITFADINAQATWSDITDRGGWSVNFSSRDVPAGHRITGLDLQLAVSADGGEVPPVAAVFVNDNLAASMAVASSGPVHINVALPDGLIGLENTLRVVVQRHPKGGECMSLPRGYPAQLLPSSSFVLSPSSAVTDFYQFPSDARRGLQVALASQTPGDVLKALPLLAETVAQLTPRDAPLSVHFGPAAAETFHLLRRCAASGIRHAGDFGAGDFTVSARNGRVPPIRRAPTMWPSSSS